MIRVLAIPALLGKQPIMVVRLIFGEDDATSSSVIANYHPDDLRELELVVELGKRYEQLKAIQ